MIEVKNIGFSIGSKSIIKDISFEIKPGEFCSIVGANGAGKSTLLKVLTKEYTPSEGEIIFNGIPLQKLKPADLAKKRSVLAQQNHIDLNFKVKDIVLMGRYPFYDTSPTRADWNIVESCLCKVGIIDFANRDYPTLSGGEQQRVQLARTLAQIWNVPSSYLFLDEPTTGMDLKHQFETFQIAKELSRNGYGVLAVVHDLNLACQYSDKVVVLKNGKILTMGSAESTLTADTIREAFDMPVSIFKPYPEHGPVILPIITEKLTS